MSFLHLSREVSKALEMCHLGFQGLEKVEDLVDVLQRPGDVADVGVCASRSPRFKIFVRGCIDIEPVAPRPSLSGTRSRSIFVDVAKNMFHSIRVVFLELDDTEVSFLSWSHSSAKNATD